MLQLLRPGHLMRGKRVMPPLPLDDDDTVYMAVFCAMPMRRNDAGVPAMLRGCVGFRLAVRSRMLHRLVRCGSVGHGQQRGREQQQGSGDNSARWRRTQSEMDAVHSDTTLSVESKRDAEQDTWEKHERASRLYREQHCGKVENASCWDAIAWEVPEGSALR